MVVQLKERESDNVEGQTGSTTSHVFKKKHPPRCTVRGVCPEHGAISDQNCIQQSPIQEQKAES